MKKIITSAILLLSLSLSVAFAMPEFSLYGDIGYGTFIYDGDADFNLYSTSKIGTKVKVRDDLSVKFEYGTQTNAMRFYYATLNLKNGAKLYLGQKNAPMNYFYAAQIYRNEAYLNDLGSIYTGKMPMVQYSENGFDIAAMEVSGVTDKVILQAAYSGTMTNLEYKLSGAVAGDDYALALGGKYTAGNMYYSLVAYSAKDTVAMNIWNRNNTADTQVGGATSIGCVVDSKLTVEAGYGSITNTKGTDDNVNSFYVNMPYQYDENITFTPELGYFSDTKENYGGVYTRIHF